ncbi:AAA family ATPase [Neisseria weaveri]|uniref:AAA family ATPase n=1 Tax=Neisseria weaveri TaxID=28091 RepID=UPI0007C9AF2B|nr:AAA family ATPase [Neisseria weaveri]SAY51880.1 cytochrome c biogenesis protein CcmA [Neisseria weaveri]
MLIKNNHHKIVRIEIKKLFGRFNYNIDLSSEENFIKIITAPNGYGKSTILKIVEAFVQNNFLFFVHTDFQEIKFFISNSSKPIVFKKTKSNYYIDEINITYLSHQSLLDGNFFDAITNLENFLPIYRTGENQWKSFDSENIILTLPDVIRKFKGHTSIFELTRNFDWLIEITQQIQVLYISTNRLINFSHVQDHREVTDYEKNSLTIFGLQNSIQELIQKSLRIQFNENRKKEASFPERLLKQLDKSQNSNRAPKIFKLLTKIGEYEKNFQSLGILSNITLNPNSVSSLISHIRDNAGAKVLEVYLTDIVERLAKLEPLANKISLFKKNLNDLLSFKCIKISPEIGFEIYPINNQRKTESISLDELSSGEQHLILLIGELIFNINSDTLVLIDEPEISLHPAWQEEFINILRKIQGINSFSVVIATHAPALINGNWDSVLELSEQYWNDNK